MPSIPDIVLEGFNRDEPDSDALRASEPARIGQPVKLLLAMQSGKPANVLMVGEVFVLHDEAHVSAIVELDSGGPPALRGLWHAALARDDQRWRLEALDEIVPVLDAVDLATLDESLRRALGTRLSAHTDELDLEHAPLMELSLLAMRFQPTAANVRRAALTFTDGRDRLARLADEALSLGVAEEPLLRCVVELYERLQLVDEALSIARRASERLPGQWFPWARLAVLTKDDAAAERAADRALELLGESDEHRERARLHFLRAGMRLRRKAIEPAEADYRQAAQLAPESPAHHMGLAALLRDREDFEEAERVCEQAVAAGKDHAPAWAMRADFRSRRGDTVAAMRDYERAIALRPKDPAYYYRRALLRRKVGDVQLARSDFEKAQSLGHPEAGSALRALVQEVIDVGSRVRHSKFGQGEVVGIELGSGERKITVAFEGAGKKTLLERFLERL